MNNRILAGFIGLAALAIVCGCKGLGQGDTAPANAPAFTLTDQDGRKVSLSDFAGKIVVLEWTNPKCPFVGRHYKAGTMIKLHEKYKDQGVVWLAINSTHTDDVQKNKQWAEAKDIPYPVLDDSNGEVGKAYGALSTPHMFVIDAKGVIAYRGAIDNDIAGTHKDAVNYVDQALTELLDGKPVSTPVSKPYGCTVKYAH